MVDYSDPNFYVEDLPDRSQFHEWVGRCIKRWAALEGFLFETADWALNTDRSLSAIVFFRTPSLDARLTLVSDLLKRTLRDEKPLSSRSPTHLDMWTRLEKAIRGQLEFRNALAHQPVETDYARLLNDKSPLPDGASKSDRARVIVQHRADKLRRPSKLGPISIEAMQKHHQDVTKLTQRLYVLHRKLDSYCEPIERPLELRSRSARRRSAPTA